MNSVIPVPSCVLCCVVFCVVINILHDGTYDIVGSVSEVAQHFEQADAGEVAEDDAASE